MLLRPIQRHYSAVSTVPHIQDQSLHQRNQIERASLAGVCLPHGDEPMMTLKNGGVIPAAQDPTDPSTWRVPVVFT